MRSRRRRQYAGWLLAAMLAGACRSAAHEGPDDRPDILLVCIDALRPDRTAPYGGRRETSPTLAALARESIVFENAFTVASWTKPSVPSLLTGLFPTQHGVITGGAEAADVLAAEVVTLAERLHDAGYATAAMVDNVHLRRRYSSMHQGFETYREDAGDAESIATAFLAWAEGARRPWFAYLHFMDVHWPYAPPEPPLGPALALPARLLAVHWDVRGRRWPLVRDAVRARALVPSDEEIDALKALYDAELFAVDAVLGRITAALDARGLLDRTAIVITADHGEGFGEHGFLDHGYGLYDELLRIPLILRLPGRRGAGTRVSRSAQIVDVAPTLLEIAGVNAPAVYGSESLVRFAEGSRSTAAPRTAFAEEVHGAVRTTALRTERYKYIATEGSSADAATRHVVPAGLAAGTRVRVEGVVVGGALVTDDVKHVEGDDTDCELQGPIGGVDTARRTLRLLDRRVALAGDAGGATEALRPMDWVRAHGRIGDGELVAKKVERDADARREIEIEGIVEGVRTDARRETWIDLCGFRVLVHDDARWNGTVLPRTGPEDAAATTASAAGARQEELYDLIADPAEQADVAAAHADVTRDLRAAAEAMQRRLRDTAVVRGRTTAAVDAEQRERLRALGYVD